MEFSCEYTGGVSERPDDMLEYVEEEPVEVERVRD